jgi:hypothetical protein
MPHHFREYIPMITGTIISLVIILRTGKRWHIFRRD